MHTVVEETWRDARRGKMLAAAARVFAHSSFEHTAMDEIAREAGVGKPTLYRYFPSKDALFVAVFENALDDLESRLDAVLDKTFDAQSRLSALVAEIIPTFRQHLVSLRFLGDSAAAADRSMRRIFRSRRARIAAYLATAIDDGVRRGEIRPVEGAKVGQIVIGMLWSATATIPSPDDDIRHDVVDLVLHGLVPRAPDRDDALDEPDRSRADGRSPSQTILNGAPS